MKMNKKLVALLMAATMVCGGTAVFAEEAEAPADPLAVSVGESSVKTGDTLADGSAITATGSTAGAVLNINMPDTMTYFINPYNLEDKEQVISPEVTIENFGATDVKVTLSNLVGTVAGKATLATTKVDSAKSVKQEAFLYLNFADAEGNYSDINAADATTAANAVKAAANTAVKASGFKPYAVGNMGKSADVGNAAGGSVKFKISGNANGKVEWTADDKIEVVPTFKFAATTIDAE